MKNYYDELEVSKTASKEVIEKVYKLLAKKYHPDTTTLDKGLAEEKFKVISEAYEILSDDNKRKKYDLELEKSNPTVSYEEYMSVVNERNTLNNSLNNLKNKFNNSRPSGTTNYQNGYYSNINTQNQYYNPNTQNTSYQNYTNSNTTNNSGKKKYYYTDTGKPASAFAYFKYRIKEFFSNIGLLLLSIIAAIFILNAFLDFNLFSLFL